MSLSFLSPYLLLLPCIPIQTTDSLVAPISHHCLVPAVLRCQRWQRHPLRPRHRSARPLLEPSCSSPPLLPRARRWASPSSSRPDLSVASTNIIRRVSLAAAKQRRDVYPKVECIAIIQYICTRIHICTAATNCYASHAHARPHLSNQHKRRQYDQGQGKERRF